MKIEKLQSFLVVFVSLALGFVGFWVSWLKSFADLKTFNICWKIWSPYHQMSILGFLEESDIIFRIFTNLFDGSSGFSVPLPPFPTFYKLSMAQTLRFPNTIFQKLIRFCFLNYLEIFGVSKDK